MTTYSCEAVRRALQKFDVVYTNIGDAQKGYRNESYPITTADGDTINILFYKRESGILRKIQAADGVSAYLAECELPVRYAIDSRTLKLSSPYGHDAFARLYNYLPGATIPWEDYTKHHIKLLGWAMSDMHDALMGCDVTRVTLPLAGEWSLATIDAITEYTGRLGVRHSMASKLGIALRHDILASIPRFIAQIDDGGVMHPLHMDMVRGDVLFGESGAESGWKIGGVQLTGIIDFEKVANGSPMYDIARTLAFLLVDCRRKTPDQIYKYFLHSGYNKRGRATFDSSAHMGTVAQGQLLHGLVLFFLLHDFYKLLLHTPYESLAKNYHYIGTRDMLIRYGVLSYV